MQRGLHMLLLLCFLCSFSIGFSWIVSKKALLLPSSSSSSSIRNRAVSSALSMVATENVPTTKRQLTNPMDSPSVIKYTKDPANGVMNAFDSPSVLSNGVDSAQTINPEESPSVLMLRRRQQDKDNDANSNPLKSPGIIFQGLDSAKIQNAMTSPSLQVSSAAKTALDMPLNLIVGQEAIKTALILLAIDPKIGGIVITGGRGTAKSVMARALHRVMPPIEVVKHSPYNIDPRARSRKDIDDFLYEELAKQGKTLEAFVAEEDAKTGEVRTEVVPCPFVQVPVNVMEDRLFGSVDVKKTMETGTTVFTPGLLASAHRGILYIDDVNLLDTELVTLLLQAVTDGFVQVEREGVSVRYPCQPLLIATASTDNEGGGGSSSSGLSDAVLDRVGIALSADSEALSLEDRVQAVNTVLGFNSLVSPASSSASTASSSGSTSGLDGSNSGLDGFGASNGGLDGEIASSSAQSAAKSSNKDDSNGQLLLSREALTRAYASEQALQTAIVFAREYLNDVQLASTQVRYLCEEAGKGGVQGHRGELVASRVAKAAAALDSSSTVRADDLRLAVKLALLPRSIYRDISPEMMDELMPPPPPPPPPPAAQENAQDDAPETENNEDNEEDKDEEDEKEDEKDDKQDEEEEEEEEEEMPEEEEPTIPEEFVFDAIAVEMDGEMMKFGGKQRSGKGGKSGLLFSRDRGRYLRPVLPREGQPMRIAIDATLREAAKHQGYRRLSAQTTTQTTKTQLSKEQIEKKIFLEPSDLRAKLMARKAGSLLIFVVDASGSMALNRMNAAKGAAVALLQEAYQSRDKIALIPFQGNRAEVLLPPTRSISLAKNRLDTMPCGGGSPLAHALTQAVKTGTNAMASGDTGRCVIVLISDGRANVPLDASLQQVDNGDKDKESSGSGASSAGLGNNNVPPPPQLSDAEKKEQRQQLKDEIIGISRMIGEMSAMKLLVIDTENKFVSTGFAKEIAQAANGRYHFIPKASADAMKQVTVDAVASLKREQSSRR